MKLAYPRKSILNFMSLFFIVSGIAIFLYFTWTSIYWGRFDLFNFLVSICGIVLVIIAVKLDLFVFIFKKTPKIAQTSLLFVFVCLLLSFLIVNFLILFFVHDKPEPDADYIIVLGCQVDGDIPSIPLMRRINSAIGYLKDNPDTMAVVTGGQGYGENISEAEAMKRVLLRSGIEENRIYIEDRATSTTENLTFSNELYDLLDKDIVMVTSDYHIYRTLSVAKKLGYLNVSGLPARSQRSMLPAYVIREYVTVMYYLVTGRLL